ncbi:lysosomal-trafficking regulator [Salvelinus alpinus]
MANPHLANLAFAWEKYMDCRVQGAELQVSLQCLESFLCLFHCVRHLHSSHGNKDALKFCSDMSGASNTLAREFLTDVHQLCSAVAQRAESRGEEDEESHMVALGEYLVRGRGFLLLSALDSIIDQELTCREELLTLLLSLLPLVWKIPVQEDKAPDFTLLSLLEVFLSREVNAVPQRAGKDQKTGSLHSEKRSRGGGSSSSTWKVLRRSRRTAQRYSVRDARRAQLSTSDSDANSDNKAVAGGTGGVRSRRSRGSTIRVSCQHHRSEAPLLPSPPVPPPEKTMALPFPLLPQPRSLTGSQTSLDTETLTDPAAMSIFNRMENSPFDLCHVLLSLLEKVCKFDMSINHNPGLAVSVVPTLTEILTEFGDCCGPGGGEGVEELAGGWTEEPIALVQRMLLRTILHLMSVDVGQSEALPDSLRRSLTDLLRATLKIRSCLERQVDPFAPRPKKTLQEVQEDFSFSRWRHRSLLLPELLEGVLQVLLGCLQASAPNPFFFSQALELLHEFIQHRGLELFEATVLRLEGLGRARDSEVGGEAADRLKGLISGVLKIISAVKTAKSEQLHQSVCARRRHRRCEYSHFLHHHRDLSGLPVSAFKQAARRNPFEETEGKEGVGDVVRYPDRCCCLAACAHQCLRLLQRLSSSGPAVLQVLAGVQAVGICCCMDPRSVVGPLLHAFQAPGLRSYQSHILSVLSRLILDQLGGGQPSEKAKLASCNICTLDSSQLPGLEETLQQGEVGVSSPTLSYRSHGILPSGGGAEDMLWKWEALEAYQGLVFGEDQTLSQQVAGHMCHLMLRGNAVVQWQLYTHIFNPVLQRGVELVHHAQQLGVSTSCSQVCTYHVQCLPVEVLLVYLQTLPTLLKSRVIRNLFLSCNGLNQVTELIYLDQTRAWALKVFDTLILGVGVEHQVQEHAEAQEREATLGLADELGSRGAGSTAGPIGEGGPQSLSKFYECLKEARPRGRIGPGAGKGRVRGETHLNTINLFLCVAFLCVSKEADSDRDSVNDSEDTSGYDSTASEPLGGRLPCLSPDSVALPSKEQLQGAVKTILTAFQSILSQSDASYEDCQTVLVELLVAMMSQRITAEELALLIRLFQEKNPPTDILLKGVLQIVQANVDMEPLYFLSYPMILGGASFPGGTSPGSRQNGGSGGKGVGMLWKGGKLSPGRREGDGREDPGHLRTSPWHVAPLHLPLVGQNCWPHMASGFSASVWIKVAENEEGEGHAEKEEGKAPTLEPDLGATPDGQRVVEESLMHILSMGSKAMMLQVWADLSTGVFTFRMCIDPNDEMKAGLLAQAESGEGLVSPGSWHHLGISYTQQPEGKKNIHGRLALWVNGVRKCEVSLDYTLPRKSSLSSDSNKTFCLLGHCTGHSEDVTRQGGQYDMGTVLLFNGSRIGSEEAFYLYASGPDLTSIMPCKYGKPSGTFSKYVTTDGLKCDTVRELMMKNKDVDTAALIECLAVVYAPSSPRVYTIYEPVIRLKGQAKTMVSQRPFSSREVQSAVLETHVLRTMLPAEPQGLQNVLHKIGGTGSFVFLFARVVELSDSEQTQALALQVLLSLAKYNQHRINEMDCYHGYSMIHQVLIKSKCIVGYHILKTLLDGSCSSPILTLGEDGQFHLDTESTAVVQDIKLLSEVLLDWKIWAKAQGGVWETLLAALEILIRVHHPQQVFNIRQFLKAEVVHHFLLTCQVLQEHRDEHLTSIPQEVCLSFVKIIQEVLGSPPDLDLLRLVYNFLLAVHPPTNTYVCHTPTSFYFSLHIDGKLYQEKVQSIMYMRNINSGWKSAGSSAASLSTAVFTEDPLPEGTIHLQPPSPEHGGDDQSLSLRPANLTPSPNSSPLLRPCVGHGGAGSPRAGQEGEGVILGSTETLKRGGGGGVGEEQLLSSCESAKTICDSREGGEAPHTPSISIEEVELRGEVDGEEGVEERGEVDSLVEGSVGGAESEDRFDWASDEVPQRPDSLKGITSFQRSSSNLASLGLAFPAQNGSLALGRWPSVADRGTLPEDWESYSYSPGYERAYSKDSSNDRTSTEDCLVLICYGLYDLLRGVLLLLPDLMLEEVMDKLVQPEALIVLVNHSSPLIQQGVMKLLDAYFSRAFKEQKEKFLKNHGFSLLANQLYLHQGTQGLLEVFLEMLFGRPVGLEEDLDLEDMETISPFRKRCIIPVLGLIENSLCENSLVHNVLCMLLQLVNACPKLADILLDHGLLYVLFNTLSTLNGMEHGIPLNDYKLLVVDIQQLLVAVTIHSCSSSGAQYFRIIEDLITLLGFMETSKMRRTQEMAVALQFRVLQSAIEFIKTTANQDPQKLSSSVNVPTSSHHAIYQKRKSIAGSMAMVMRDCIIPRIPRQHYCSYGQIPLPPPFCFLSETSPLPSPTGTASYVFLCDSGRRRFSLAQSDSLLTRMRSVASDELNQMMQRRMSQENPIRASETEFIQRLQRLLVLAVNRLIYHDVSQDFYDLLNFSDSPDPVDPVDHAPEEDGSIPSSSGHTPGPPSPLPFPLPPANMKSFQKDILRLMMDGIKISLGSTGRGGAPRQQWRRILWSCRDTFRVQIGRLLVHTLSPALPLRDRKEALEFVFDPANPDFLKESLSPGLEHGPKLAMYLYEMLHDHKDALTKEEQITVCNFMTSLKLWGHRCIPPSAPYKPDLLKAIKEEQLKYEADEKSSKLAWEKKISNTQKSLIQRLDGKSKDISKIAADITQNVSLRQGMERKKVIQHIRGLYKIDLSASRHWQELVQQLTHDRAVWYDQMSYPTSWQLDPTEGPNRERRRLQRCYLTIPNKYLLKDRRKPDDPAARAPLSFLFEDKTHSSFSSTVKDKATSEPIRFTRRCISVAPSRETSGELLLGKSGMYFVEDNAADAHDNQSVHGETEAASFSWTYEEIKEVHKRWWQLRDNAVEIFLTNGRTLLLAFHTTKFRDDVYHNILTSDLPNLLEYGNITALTHLWGSGQISNFEYLTHLNKHSGRSFNDLMQYPVFPFILKDYISETLDLGDSAIYRNLNKPIAVQSKEKEDRYVDNYKYLEEEYRKGAHEDDPMPPVQPYHYGSHYSNSGTVLHFLVRMPPFTKMFLAYQDQSFDIPDRTFHSMNTTWRLSSFESMTDVKELIPEFFYLPEFLVNREGFDFGVRQNSERVNHVNLPPWARNDPRLFILIHRQALESDQVSQTLCQWIDLVFGLKQKGKAAVHAINVFHPATYFGMDVSSVEDPVQRRALETMIKTYGQTPRQLFSASHISRAGPRLMEGELPAAMGLLVQLAFRETREQVKDIVYPSPLSWIKGLKWGEYVGSPSSPDPAVCFSQPHGERFGSLLALPTRAICGLSRNFCLMMIYSKEQGVRSMHSTDIQWSAILSWGYADNMLRLKSKQSEPPINFIQCSPLHQVTACAWVSDGCQLFTGSRCGVITAYINRFNTTTPTEMEVESQVHLYGHSSEVTSLHVCKPYSILISVSRDGTCILWDLNRLCYVQSLTGHKSPVTAVSASETTGDIATVCDSVGGGSDLRLWTVNGDLIGHVHCREIICSVAFSNQPEGVSVNVITGGLENGVVRLWSTWDLKPVREITFPKSNKPIISLTYSCDGHHLYTANSEGTVMAWCRRDQQRMKLPMFYSFLSSYAAS